MSKDPFSLFANQLATELSAQHSAFSKDSLHEQVLRVPAEESAVFELDMTPFACRPAAVTALPYFDGIGGVSQLLSAYRAAKSSLPFEMDLAAARERVSDYAEEFIDEILAKANTELSDAQACIIANWVKQLDVYCAVKAIESFLYSRADLCLLEIAPERGWDVVFDHLAIRCGSQAHAAAERIAGLLKKSHGYGSTQFPREAFYQFADGWNAYPVYKMLDNGQALRIFVDQSDVDDDAQIIQHWNHVYGYTAHHMAIRATYNKGGQRYAVPLEEVMEALQENGIRILTPTGHYTQGLLLQVFTQPEINSNVPDRIKNALARHGERLASVIENAKLLELVSRREMSTTQAQAYFSLYGLRYDVNNPLHSAPCYQYFLPAQAAHVIKTSQQVD